MWRCLILVAALAHVVHSKGFSCPWNCHCYIDSDGYQAASCTTSGLASFRESGSAFVEVLRVVPSPKSSPVRLTNDMFNGFKSLKVLNLANASISQVPIGVFDGLFSVIDIDLSYNRITTLSGLPFRKLSDLQTLILRGNSLALHRFDRLNSYSLKELDLGECHLKTIPEGTLNGVESLTHLSLDGNYLQTISFTNLPHNLRYLNLANNKIVNVPIDDLLSRSFLRVLDLSGNPVNCTCHLLNMLNWISGKGVTFENDFMCHFPHMFRGKMSNQINEDEICGYEMEEQHMREKHMFKMKYQDYNFYGKRNERNLFNEQDVMADQPLAENAETLFSNDYTRSLSTHMEHKAEEKDKEYIEGSGDSPDAFESDEFKNTDPDEINTNSEEVTTAKDDSSPSSFEFTVSDLENDLNNKSLNETTEFPESNNMFIHVGHLNDVNKTENEEDEGSALEPEPDTEGSGLNLLTNNGSSSSEAPTELSSETPVSTTVVTETNFSWDDGTTTDAIDVMSSVEPFGTSLQEGSSTFKSTTDGVPSSEDVTTEHALSTKPVEVTETFQKHTINDTLEKYSDISTEASVSNVTVDGVLSADMSGIYQISTYLLVAIITLPIIILILMAIYKKRAPRKIRLPQDNESNMGTELQDMDTLLPKNGTENGVKVVAKANGAANPSDSKDPEEIKPVLESAEQEEPSTAAATPIQRTKAKLTILPDSVPKTPVFIHKAYPD